jgi:hypothetical protein
MSDDALRRKVENLRCDVQVLSELAAVLIAELAYDHADPVARLEEIIGSEEAVAMGAVGGVDATDPAIKAILKRKEAKREFVFDIARMAAARMQKTR